MENTMNNNNVATTTTNLNGSKTWKVIEGYYVAMHSCNDAILQNSAEVRRLSSNVQSYEAERISALEEPSTHREQSLIIADIKRYKEELETAKAKDTSAKATQKKKCESALSLVTDALYKAYKESLFGDNNTFESAMLEWICNTFKVESANITTVRTFCGFVGNHTNVGKGMKKNDLASAYNRDKFAIVLISSVSVWAKSKNYIKAYTYKYIEPKKNNK